MKILLAFFLLFPILSFSQNTCPCPPPAGSSIWPSTAKPTLTDSTDTKAVELGVKFQSSTAGVIQGIRFYKASTNTGSHIGNLWNANGVLMGSVVFTNETASGWQTANFLSPVAINPNTTYIASYFAPGGHYSADRPFFTSAVVNPPLTAISNATSVNGIYHYGASSAFPSTSTQSTNYWVDLVFSAVAPVPMAPTITSSASVTGTVGSPFSYQIVATQAPMSYGATGLPAGLTLNTAIGIIAGTPLVAATAVVTLSATNATGTGTMTLTMAILAAPAHATVLTWSASVSSGVQGYNVYSSPTTGGPYGLLTRVNGVTLTDSNVSAGQTKNYVIRAIGSTGAESANSMEVSALTPQS